jgi:hypothetical protein
MIAWYVVGMKRVRSRSKGSLMLSRSDDPAERTDRAYSPEEFCEEAQNGKGILRRVIGVW